jgi:hypothetical protein
MKATVPCRDDSMIIVNNFLQVADRHGGSSQLVNLENLR